MCEGNGSIDESRPIYISEDLRVDRCIRCMVCDMYEKPNRANMGFMDFIDFGCLLPCISISIHCGGSLAHAWARGFPLNKKKTELSVGSKNCMKIWILSHNGNISMCRSRPRSSKWFWA